MDFYSALQVLKIGSWGVLIYPPFKVLKSVFKKENYDAVRKWQKRWGTYIVKNCFKCNLVVNGTEKIPQQKTGFIIISNHKSFADIPIMMDVLNGPSFLLRSGIAKIPFIGWWAKEFGISFNREDLKDRKKVPQRVENFLPKNRVVVFPEGTRITKKELGKIHKGMLIHAVSNKIPVLVVAHYGTQKIIPRDNSKIVPNQTVTFQIGSFLTEYNRETGVDDILKIFYKTYEKARIDYQNITGEE